MAGAEIVARRFPLRVGRGTTDHFRLQAHGVWERHLELTCPGAGPVELCARPEALTLVNGQPVQTAKLANGDVIQIGGLVLQFSLSPAKQARLNWREGFFWLALAALVAVQVVLIKTLVL
jgi:pSer/pThr/pTyr-binding forkhead associated (FHA) protein